MSWQDQAACRDMDSDLFFPEMRGKFAPGRQARNVCGVCEVARECLEFAVTNRMQFGIWGGMGRRDRERIGVAV